MIETISTFLACVERVTKLVSLRRESRRQFFEEAVEPLFRDLEPVVDDYYSVLCRCHEMLRGKDRLALEAVRNEISGLREQQLIARNKVKALADSLTEHSSDAQLARFARNICSIFEAGEPKFERKLSRLSALLVHDLFQDVRDSDVNRDRLIEAVQDAKNAVATGWIAVVQSYGYLRLRSAQ